jgi:lipopolysaccharide export system protein LptA
MTRWQRPVRLGLALLAATVLVAVALNLRGRAPDPAASTATGRTDPTAVAESTGGSAVVARGTRRDFTVDYERARTYDDGTLKAESVTVTVPQRAGKDFTIKSRDATVTDNQAKVAMSGEVHLTASDGLDLRTDTATFDNREGLVRAPGTVTFTRGHLSGRATGATYDQARDVLWLLDQVRLRIGPDPQGGGAADITSGAAGFAQRERYLRFERGVRVQRSGRVIEADAGVGYLADAEDRLETLELRGNARVSSAAPAAGGLETMSARDMNLVYAPDGQTLQQAALSGSSVLQLAAPAGQRGRRLAAEAMDLGLGPDGATLVSIVARSGVVLDLPAADAGPSRRIDAQTLSASGPPDGGITQARFEEAVVFRERRPGTGQATPPERVARSRTLDVAMDPGFGGLRTANFGGGVTFEDGTTRAAGATALYDIAAGRLRLAVGPTGGAARAARVDDARATVDAARIDLTLDGGGMVADTDVRSVLKPAPAREPGGGGRRPGLLEPSQSVNVTAARLTYDSRSRRATYTGDARLWQGETAVQGATIVLDEERGDLTAEGNVRSTLRLRRRGAEGAAGEARTTVLMAETLVYDDAARRATYTTNARMNGPEGDLRAATIELHLDEAGRALDRAEAYTEVSLRADTRAATGARLTYFAADERYVMSGTPVRVLEQLPQECRETLGRTLTFYRSAATISVDGNEETRTQTTSSGKCPEPRSR